MAILLNMIPNVYWIYKNSSSNMPENNYKMELLKVKELYGINSVIELDNVLCEFWNKSSSYINEIKTEMVKNEYSKLLLIYKKLLNTIKKAYLNNVPILISTYKKDFLDIGLGIWIYFFYITARLSFDAVIKLLELKVIGILEITESIKNFFALLNINHIHT